MPGGSAPGQRHAPNGAGSVYKETITRADGSTYVRWTGALSLGNGTRKKVTGRTQKAVVAELAKLKAELQAGQPITTERQTVAEYLEWWLHNSLRCKPTSFRAYEVLVRVHLIPRLGKRQVRKLEPEHVEQMLGNLRKDGVSDDRINKVRACLVQALNVLVKRRRLSFNAAALVDPYRVEHDEPEPMEPEECQRWLTLLRDSRVGTACTLAMTTGLRQGEILGLLWLDAAHPEGGLDLKRGRVRVVQQMAIFKDEEGKLRPALQGPKSKAGRRWVPIPSFVVTVLRAHAEYQQLVRTVAGESWQDLGLVFPTGRGTPWNANDFRRCYYVARRAVGLPETVPFHGLRHVYRSLLMHLGVSEGVAMRLMGHESPAMSQRYSHLLDSAMIDAADRLDALLREPHNGDAPRSALPVETGPENDRQ